MKSPVTHAAPDDDMSLSRYATMGSLELKSSKEQDANVSYKLVPRFIDFGLSRPISRMKDKEKQVAIQWDRQRAWDSIWTQRHRMKLNPDESLDLRRYYTSASTASGVSDKMNYQPWWQRLGKIF